MVAGLGVLARFYYVRNVFEIRARYEVVSLTLSRRLGTLGME